ncbi:branched-chain amino acid ABC transporter permease, partial [Bordetella hinzii]|nr:branched-chain amino acid ABC transporter permease [Bordetella hinzii]
MSGLIMQGLINGLILGAIYGLIGVGLNVIFGVLRVVNFAHGEFLVLGAYFAYYLMEYAGINPLIALPLSFAAFFLAGYLLYFVLIPRLSKAEDPEISSL